MKKLSGFKQYVPEVYRWWLRAFSEIAFSQISTWFVTRSTAKYLVYITSRKNQNLVHDEKYAIMKVQLDQHYCHMQSSVNSTTCYMESTKLTPQHFPPGYNLECEKSTSVNYFWYRETLNITDDIETSGSLQWWIVVCLASSWCIIFTCFIKGIDSMGKVSRGVIWLIVVSETVLIFFLCLLQGCLRDCHLPLLGAHHFPGPWPHSAWSYWWPRVPFHS